MKILVNTTVEHIVRKVVKIVIGDVKKRGKRQGEAREARRVRRGKEE